MKLISKTLGACEVTVYVDSFSSVDSYIVEGFSYTLDRELTEEDLALLDAECVAEIQEYSYENGSRNHN